MQNKYFGEKSFDSFLQNPYIRDVQFYEKENDQYKNFCIFFFTDQNNRAIKDRNKDSPSNFPQNLENEMPHHFFFPDKFALSFLIPLYYGNIFQGGARIKRKLWKEIPEDAIFEDPEKNNFNLEDIKNQIAVFMSEIKNCCISRTSSSDIHFLRLQVHLYSFHFENKILYFRVYFEQIYRSIMEWKSGLRFILNQTSFNISQAFLEEAICCFPPSESSIKQHAWVSSEKSMECYKELVRRVLVKAIIINYKTNNAAEVLTASFVHTLIAKTQVFHENMFLPNSITDNKMRSFLCVEQAFSFFYCRPISTILGSQSINNKTFDSSIWSFITWFKQPQVFCHLLKCLRNDAAIGAQGIHVLPGTFSYCTSLMEAFLGCLLNFVSSFRNERNLFEIPITCLDNTTFCWLTSCVRPEALENCHFNKCSLTYLVSAASTTFPVNGERRPIVDPLCCSLFCNLFTSWIIADESTTKKRTEINTEKTLKVGNTEYDGFILNSDNLSLYSLVGMEIPVSVIHTSLLVEHRKRLVKFLNPYYTDTVLLTEDTKSEDVIVNSNILLQANDKDTSSLLKTIASFSRSQFLSIDENNTFNFVSAATFEFTFLQTLRFWFSNSTESLYENILYHFYFCFHVFQQDCSQSCRMSGITMTCGSSNIFKSWVLGNIVCPALVNDSVKLSVVPGKIFTKGKFDIQFIMQKVTYIEEMTPVTKHSFDKMKATLSSHTVFGELKNSNATHHRTSFAYFGGCNYVSPVAIEEDSTLITSVFKRFLACSLINKSRLECDNFLEENELMLRARDKDIIAACISYCRFFLKNTRINPDFIPNYPTIPEEIDKRFNSLFSNNMLNKLTNCTFLRVSLFSCYFESYKDYNKGTEEEVHNLKLKLPFTRLYDCKLNNIPYKTANIDKFLNFYTGNLGLGLYPYFTGDIFTEGLWERNFMDAATHNALCANFIPLNCSNLALGYSYLRFYTGTVPQLENGCTSEKVGSIYEYFVHLARRNFSFINWQQMLEIYPNHFLFKSIQGMKGELIDRIYSFMYYFKPGIVNDLNVQMFIYSTSLFPSCITSTSDYDWGLDKQFFRGKEELPHPSMQVDNSFTFQDEFKSFLPPRKLSNTLKITNGTMNGDVIEKQNKDKIYELIDNKYQMTLENIPTFSFALNVTLTTANVLDDLIHNFFGEYKEFIKYEVINSNIVFNSLPFKVSSSYFINNTEESNKKRKPNNNDK